MKTLFNVLDELLEFLLYYSSNTSCNPFCRCCSDLFWEIGNDVDSLELLTTLSEQVAEAKK